MAGGKTSGSDIGLLVLRVALGAIFVAHGVQKVTSEGGVGAFADFLASLNVPYPYPAAIVAISSEIAGGLLVVLGLFARIGALSLVGVMAVAIWKVHLPNGFFLKLSAEKPGPIPHGVEFNVALLAMALCIVLAGSGSISLVPSKPKPKKGA
jgi:putative oxidoreductase